MGRVVQMIGGIPTTIESTVTTYQATYVVSAPLNINDQVTLPNSETYNGTIDELAVNRNGVDWVEGVQYEYQNSSTATWIKMLIAIPSGGRINFYKVA